MQIILSGKQLKPNKLRERTYLFIYQPLFCLKKCRQKNLSMLPFVHMSEVWWAGRIYAESSSTRHPVVSCFWGALQECVIKYLLFLIYL